MIRNVKILSTGRYLPNNPVSSASLDEKLGLKVGTIEEKTGMRNRFYVTDESASYMGAEAAKKALAKANLTVNDIDCIVSTSGVPEQPIPSNASLIQEKLGLGDSGIPCFDVNATCLSYIAGLDLVSHAIHNGQYKNVLMVSSDVASSGINYDHLESAALFGDGAVATILTRDPQSKIICSSLRTYSSGAHYTEIRGGGNRMPAPQYSPERKADFLFHMDGRRIFKLAYEKIEGFIDEALKPTGQNLEENLASIKAVIPHQASPSSLRLIQRQLKIDDGKFLNICRDYGNMVSVSLPLALDEAITTGMLKRGEKALLFGAGAGMSFGAILLEY